MKNIGKYIRKIPFFVYFRGHYMVFVFWLSATYSARPCGFYRQMGAHRYVCRNMHNNMDRISQTSPCARENETVRMGMASPDTYERTDRDTARKLHRRQKKRRLARLCGQFYRRNACCRYRYSSGKVSRQTLKGELRSDEL